MLVFVASFALVVVYRLLSVCVGFCYVACFDVCYDYLVLCYFLVLIVVVLLLFV